MGTSASTSGAGQGSPLVPAWVEEADEVDDADTVDDESPQETETPQSVPMALRGRLTRARTDLGKFASQGDRSKLRRGVANYVRHGRGGAAMATRRSAGTARRAGSLFGIVSGSPAFDEVRNRIRDSLAASGDPQELLAAIATAASPSDGTLDSETGQRAASQALQHVLELFPNADPLALDVPQRAILLERFLALDCYELFYTEVGKHIQSKGDLIVLASRIRDIKEYFCERFRQVTQSRQASGSASFGDLSDQRITAICRGIIAEAYITFEAYLDEG